MTLGIVARFGRRHPSLNCLQLHGYLLFLRPSRRERRQPDTGRPWRAQVDDAQVRMFGLRKQGGILTSPPVIGRERHAHTAQRASQFRRTGVPGPEMRRGTQAIEAAVIVALFFLSSVSHAPDRRGQQRVEVAWTLVPAFEVEFDESELYPPIVLHRTLFIKFHSSRTTVFYFAPAISASTSA